MDSNAGAGERYQVWAVWTWGGCFSVSGICEPCEWTVAWKRVFLLQNSGCFLKIRCGVFLRGPYPSCCSTEGWVWGISAKWEMPQDARWMQGDKSLDAAVSWGCRWVVSLVISGHRDVSIPITHRTLGIRCQVNVPAVYLDQGALLTPALGCCPCSHSPCRTTVKSDYTSRNCAFVLSHFSVWMSVQGRYVPWTGCPGYNQGRHGAGAISP